MFFSTFLLLVGLFTVVSCQRGVTVKHMDYFLNQPVRGELSLLDEYHKQAMFKTTTPRPTTTPPSYYSYASFTDPDYLPGLAHYLGQYGQKQQIPQIPPELMNFLMRSNSFQIAKDPPKHLKLDGNYIMPINPIVSVTGRPIDSQKVDSNANLKPAIGRILMKPKQLLATTVKNLVDSSFEMTGDPFNLNDEEFNEIYDTPKSGEEEKGTESEEEEVTNDLITTTTTTTATTTAATPLPPIKEKEKLGDYSTVRNNVVDGETFSALRRELENVLIRHVYTTKRPTTTKVNPSTTQSQVTGRYSITTSTTTTSTPFTSVFSSTTVPTKKTSAPEQSSNPLVETSNKVPTSSTTVKPTTTKEVQSTKSVPLNVNKFTSKRFVTKSKTISSTHSPTKTIHDIMNDEPEVLVLMSSSRTTMKENAPSSVDTTVLPSTTKVVPKLHDKDAFKSINIESIEVVSDIWITKKPATTKKPAVTGKINVMAEIPITKEVVKTTSRAPSTTKITTTKAPITSKPTTTTSKTTPALSPVKVVTTIKTTTANPSTSSQSIKSNSTTTKDTTVQKETPTHQTAKVTTEYVPTTTAIPSTTTTSTTTTTTTTTTTKAPTTRMFKTTPQLKKLETLAPGALLI